MTVALPTGVSSHSTYTTSMAIALPRSSQQASTAWLPFSTSGPWHALAHRMPRYQYVINFCKSRRHHPIITFPLFPFPFISLPIIPNVAKPLVMACLGWEIGWLLGLGYCWFVIEGFGNCFDCGLWLLSFLAVTGIFFLWCSVY